MRFEETGDFGVILLYVHLSRCFMSFFCILWLVIYM